MPDLRVALQQYQEATKLYEALPCYELDGLEQSPLSEFFESLKSCNHAMPTKVQMIARFTGVIVTIPCIVTSLRSVQVPNESSDHEVADYMDVCDWVGEGYIPSFGDNTRANAVNRVWFHIETNNHDDLVEVTDGLLQFIDHQSLGY